MQHSALCLRLVKAFEGFRPRAYKDAAGFLTIGYGHKILPDEAFGELTEAHASDVLQRDLARFAHGIAGLVRPSLESYENDALISFAFNLGLGALERSTLLRQLNAEQRRLAAHEFLRWVYARDPKTGEMRVLPGLVRRRHAESALFLGAHPATVLHLAGVPQ